MLINNVKWCNDTSRFPLYTVLLLSSRYCYRISYKIQSNARNMTMKSCTGQQKVMDIITHYPLQKMYSYLLLEFHLHISCLPVVSNFVSVAHFGRGKKQTYQKCDAAGFCPVRWFTQLVSYWDASANYRCVQGTAEEEDPTFFVIRVTDQKYWKNIVILMVWGMWLCPRGNFTTLHHHQSPVCNES